jgi:hypothetical protein
MKMKMKKKTKIHAASGPAAFRILLFLSLLIFLSFVPRVGTG